MEEQVPTKSKTQRSELVLVGILFLFGIGSIIFGITRLQDRIQSPFRLSNIPEEAPNLLEGVDLEGIDVEGLKTKDTDADGLSDYQETYITQTSTYLSDTDGDGVFDKEEISRGTNPSCPEGQECFNSTATTALPIDKTLPPKQGEGSTATDPSIAVNQALQQFQSKTPDQIRIFLKEQGLPEEQLKLIPDATLQTIYTQGLEKAVKQIQQKGTLGSQQPVSQQQVPTTQQGGVSGIDPAKLADPSLLSPQEIRTILEKSGKVPLDALQKVPDAALKDIFMKAIQSSQK